MIHPVDRYQNIIKAVNKKMDEKYNCDRDFELGTEKHEQWLKFLDEATAASYLKEG